MTARMPTLGSMHRSVQRQIADIFADVGCSGWLHARSLGPRAASVGYGADAPVVLASVYKVALLVSLCRSVDRGELDLAETVRVVPQEWARGSTGLGAFADPVTLSWRDLATSMMTVSDNVAADVILARVGLDAVRSDLTDLGLRATHVVGGVAELHGRLRAETGTSTVEEAFAVLADADTDTDVTAYDAAYSSSSTPLDCTRLLAEVWADRAASPSSCAMIRDVMRHQVFTARLASGFGAGSVRVAGKTGTIGVIRNEIGVIEFTGEYPVAIAVFTKSARSAPALPAVDRAIGEVGRLVVGELRASVD